MEAADRGLAAATPVAGHLATVLGWTEEQRAAEVEAYRARVQAERAAEAQPNDQSAARTRRQRERRAVRKDAITAPASLAVIGAGPRGLVIAAKHAAPPGAR
jgi:glycerol-3-phosphate dehydrogenase